MLNKKLLYVLLFFLTLTGLAQAQFPEDDLWFEGEVELEDGQRIAGQLSFFTNEKQGLLQINTGKKVLAFDAQQIVQFSFYDHLLNRTRQFYSLPFERSDQNYSIFLFFEALYEGPYISLLSKTQMRQESRVNNSPYTYRGYYTPRWYNNGIPQNFTIWVPYETLYLVTPNTDITAYARPSALDRENPRLSKPDEEYLQKLMRDQWPEMESYLEQNKIDIRRRNDLIRTVIYYNQLKAKNQANNN